MASNDTPPEGETGGEGGGKTAGKAPTKAEVAALTAKLDDLMGQLAADREDRMSLVSRLEQLERDRERLLDERNELDGPPVESAEPPPRLPEELASMARVLNRKDVVTLVRLVETRVDAAAWALKGVHPDTHVVAVHAVKCTYDGKHGFMLQAGHPYEKSLFGKVTRGKNEIDEWKILVERELARELDPNDLRPR